LADLSPEDKQRLLKRIRIARSKVTLMLKGVFYDAFMWTSTASGIYMLLASGRAPTAAYGATLLGLVAYVQAKKDDGGVPVDPVDPVEDDSADDDDEEFESYVPPPEG
jgi:hypothetical protein